MLKRLIVSGSTLRTRANKEKAEIAENLKKNNPEFYKILSEIKVRFKFTDKSVMLEDWSELIHLDDNKEFKQVRFSPRLDYVPILEKKKLD